MDQGARPTSSSLAERTALADLEERYRAACRAASAGCPDGDAWARDRLAEALRSEA